MEFKYRHKLTIAGMIVVSMVLTSGCRANNTDSQSHMQKYGDDGLLGLTEANPNLPGNSSYHTHAVDHRMALSALSKIQGIQRTRIMINGHILNVYLKLNPQLDQAAKDKVLQEAFQAVQFNLPRYRVNVIAGNKRINELG